MPAIQDIWIYAHNVLRSSRQRVNEGLAPLGLSSAEGNILLHLFTRGREVRQEEIVGQLDISKPAVSRALDSLESKGYVARRRDPSDRRASRVLLTDRAREIRGEVERVYQEVFALAAQGISREEAAFFIELFARVSRNFSRARPADGKREGEE